MLYDPEFNFNYMCLNCYRSELLRKFKVMRTLRKLGHSKGATTLARKLCSGGFLVIALAWIKTRCAFFTVKIAVLPMWLLCHRVSNVLLWTERKSTLDQCFCVQYSVFFSSFTQLIGDLNELREKDYGDEARGAQRYVINQVGFFFIN
jgi:hypothetical protein